MTACVNRKHTKKVAAVVTASLVGALSLGVAPVVAMADDAEISTQSVDPEDAFAKGTVTYAKDNNGYIITNPEGYEFEYDGLPHHILPLQVKPDGAANTIAIDADKVDYEVYKGGRWQKVSKEGIVGIGNYRAVIPSGAISSADKDQYDEWKNGLLYMNFKIVGRSLQGATIFNAATNDITDSSFTYTGENQDFGFVIDGLRYDWNGMNWVNPGGYENPYGYPAVNVEWWNTNTNEKLASAPVDAGNYTVVLKGWGAFQGSETKINFTINKLDLSTADIFLSDMPTTVAQAGLGLPTMAYVNGVRMYTADAAATENPKNLAITWGATDPDIIRDHGVYTMNVAAISGNKNVTGSKTVTFKVADNILDAEKFTYKRSKLNGSEITVVRKVTNTYFDFTDLGYNGRALPKDAIVTITDEQGNEVAAEDVNSKVGTYTLTITFADDNFNTGLNAPVSMTIRVLKDDLWTAADLTYTWQGDVVDGAIYPTYDGEDVLAEIGTVVKSHGTTLEKGADYDVTATDINGQVVDKIVDAGVYFVNVTSDTYNIKWNDHTGTRLVVFVQPMELPNLYIGSDQLKDFGKDGSFIPYTGSDATYYFYYVVDGKEIRLPEGVIEVDHFNFDDDFTNLEDIDVNWPLDPSEWTKVDWEDVDAINAVGQYVPSVKVVNDNYFYWPDITTREDGVVNKIDVRGESVYSDLDASEWGAEEIYKAHALGYMGGYNGTSIFGKDDSIKRGDVATVLYNMAGSPEAPTEGEIKDGGYKTKFDDVDPYMYYAKAIAWANACGIISGDSGTANFRPEDPVSRQELAKMLAEYARVTGDEISADTSVLDDYKDGDEVSEWAEEYVAWAVENGIMGVDTDQLWATGRITRRHVAIMVVRYQPDGKLHDAMIPSWPR